MQTTQEYRLRLSTGQAIEYEAVLSNDAPQLKRACKYLVSHEALYARDPKMGTASLRWLVMDMTLSKTLGRIKYMFT